MKSMKLNKITQYLSQIYVLSRRLVCVPKCASCMIRLSPFSDSEPLDHGYPCLCKDCLAAWNKAKSEMCHTCAKPADECTCMPKKNIFMQPTIPSLFFYHPDQNKPQSKVIYTLKHKKYTDLYDFITEELSEKVKELLDELEIDISECIFTYIPRTRKGIKKNGFDQGELLSKKLCLRLGGNASLPLLTRNGGKEQKKLSKKKRKKNSENAIFANISKQGIKTDSDKSFSELISKKTIILIDDVITTGESMSRGINVLRHSGARTVIVASVARCEVASKRQKNTKSK